MDINPGFKTSLGKGANKILIDEVDGAIAYIGNADIGSGEEHPLWLIRRLTQTASSLKVEYAEGSTKFDQVWNDRAILAYE